MASALVLWLTAFMAVTGLSRAIAQEAYTVTVVASPTNSDWVGFYDIAGTATTNPQFEFGGTRTTGGVTLSKQGGGIRFDDSVLDLGVYDSRS